MAEDSTPHPNGDADLEPSGEPLQLVSIDTKTGKLAIHEPALKVLRDIKKPVAIVSVCGRARTGKSYLLNHVLRSTGQLGPLDPGFSIASNFKPCTKGIWTWSRPIARTGLDGKEYALVLLDTEGVEAYNQTAQDGIRIFSLSILLSSLFVYNQMGGIDEAAIEKLSLVTEVTKHVRVKATAQGPEPEDERSLGECSPSFLWLLRDFYLGLEDNGVKVSAAEYLETALMPSGTGTDVLSKNRVRSSIKSLFPDRDCFTLKRPVMDESDLRRVNTLRRDQLRPEFSADMDRLTVLLLSRALPKRVVGSQYATGPLLAGLAQMYVDAINKGAVPTITTAWQSVSDTECRRAGYAAEDAYRKAFNEEVGADEVALQQEHQRCLAVAKTAFNGLAVGDPALRREHKHRFAQACAVWFDMHRSKVLAEAAAAVDEQLYKAAGALNTVARLSDNFEVVGKEGRRVADEFLEHTSGPTRLPKLVAFLQDQYPALAQDMLNRQAEKHRAVVSELKKQIEEGKRTTLEADTRAKQAEEKLQQVMAEQAALAQRVKSAASSGGSTGALAVEHGAAPPARSGCLSCFGGGGAAGVPEPATGPGGRA